MNGPNKLPGFQRSRRGREWAICKRLPTMLALGTAQPLQVAALLWLMAPRPPDAGPDDAASMQLNYQWVG